MDFRTAVSRAHRKLFPDDVLRDPRTLQNIALALTDLLPIHWRADGRELTAPELVRLPPIDELMVSRRRFEAALEAMQAGSFRFPAWASPPASRPKTIAG